MARGWESKDVESQIDLAEERRARSQAAEVSQQQLTLTRERESIELSRTRVLADLESATNPRYRSLLERSLQFLDEKLSVLGTDPPQAT